MRLVVAVGVCVSVWWLSEVCVSVVRVSAVLRPVCLPLRVRPRVCPVPELRFERAPAGELAVPTSISLLTASLAETSVEVSDLTANAHTALGAHHEARIFGQSPSAERPDQSSCFAHVSE